jgi:D-glycero-alpha-D-manno-heptose 1-phosphate guanylyltransferase
MLEAIVLAGGFGTRLRILIPNLPKPMAPVNGKPFIEFLLDQLAQKGFDRVILSLGFMADKFVNHFGSSFKGMIIDYAIESIPLGTGGGVRLALEKSFSDHIFIFNGDTFLDLELSSVEDKWIKNRRSLIIGREVLDVSRYGCLFEKDGVAMRFSEKGMSGSGLINAGCYVITPNQLENFKLNTPFSLEEDFLRPAVLKGDFDIFITKGLFVDIGIPKDYRRAANLLNSL